MLQFTCILCIYDWREFHGSEDEREFDYLNASEKGPQHRGDLKEEWVACKNGGIQSPIDMSNQRVKIIQKNSFGASTISFVERKIISI